jgi:TonB family protein
VLGCYEIKIRITRRQDAATGALIFDDSSFGGRAVYPPLALRMGMESDVILRIEIDTEGKVTKAEITKSGGAGFDEEALKAVKQSRFEPAQKDGKNVSAEFVYVYRFRLQK